jgi:hypothetical protein
VRIGFLLSLAAMALSAACAAPPARPAASPPDQPVPKTEPRSEVRLVVDLMASADCEQRFDLALYRNRAVDLVQWDDQLGACRARSVTIRYLSRQITREQLLQEIRGLSARVVEVQNR